MREDDLFHVVIRLKILVRNLTAPLVTNEQSYLTEEPIQGRHSIENPEEQEHWVLTRREPGQPPVHQTSGSSILTPMFPRTEPQMLCDWSLKAVSPYFALLFSSPRACASVRIGRNWAVCSRVRRRIRRRTCHDEVELRTLAVTASRLHQSHENSPAPL